MAANPQHSPELDAHLRNLEKNVTDMLQNEISRLNKEPGQSSADPSFFVQLIKDLNEIQENAYHPDIVYALMTAIEHIEKAEQASKKGSSNKAVLTFLQEANAEILKCKNIRQ